MAPRKPIVVRKVKSEAAYVPIMSTVDEDQVIEPDISMVPDYWSIGALLNVRNSGEHYTVTLYPEEFDPVHPERSLRFTNHAHCQNFVSRWYARQHFDPRAR